MNILINVALDNYNTLALPAVAQYFCTCKTPAELSEALAFATQKKLAVTLLGSGSNVVFLGDIAGLVIQICLKGIDVVKRNGNGIRIKVAAGENWHELVSYTLQHQWYGLENLSLIPGLAGAAPIQNIGAYGVEIKDLFVSLEAVEIASGRQIVLQKTDCAFGYRDSIFKHSYKKRWVITSITLDLLTVAAPNFDYPELQVALSHLSNPEPQQVSEVICILRREKLPNPNDIPNAGSFFKNPIVDSTDVNILRQKYPAIPYYSQADGRKKIPAAWLIDQAGWKGYSEGSVGVHSQQALVLVHFGGARGQQLLALADKIAQDIQKKFNITLEMEPTIIG